MNVQNLMLILEDISHVPGGSHRSISERANNPLDELVFNEIIKCNPKEVDDFKNKHGKAEVVYNKVLNLKNSFLFSAFLGIGAFRPSLSPESIWTLDQVKKPSLELYQAIYQHERNEGIYVNDPKPIGKTNFIPHMTTYMAAMDTPEKKKLASLVYEKYEDNHKDLLKNSFDNIKRLSSTFMIEKLKKSIDINKNGFMEDFLKQNKEEPFFISSTHFENLKKLLSIGFRFDEARYSKYGETLMTALLSSGREEIVSIILPYLEQIKPINITLKEQTQLLDMYKNNQYYDGIKGHYYKKLYEYMLVEKNTPDAQKMKI